jgi:hypothetical protein
MTHPAANQTARSSSATSWQALKLARKKRDDDVPDPGRILGCDVSKTALLSYIPVPYQPNAIGASAK